MKKFLSGLLATALIISTFAMTASAAYTKDAASKGDVSFKGTPKAITEGVVDPLWEKADSIELTGTNKRNRAGFSASFKTMWDDKNFYILTTVVGDKDVGDKIGSHYSDQVNIVFSPFATLIDEPDDSIYNPEDKFNDSEVAFLLFRGDDEGKMQILNYDNPDPKANTEAMKATLEANKSVKELGDAEETYMIQVAIPWTGEAVAQEKNGLITGLDIWAKDNVGGGFSAPAADGGAAITGASELFYSDVDGRGGESIHNTQERRPVTLIDIPVGTDPATAEIIAAVNAIDLDAVVIENETELNALKETINALEPDQKALVNTQKLDKALEKIASLKKALEDNKAAAKVVIDQITALPATITLENEAAVMAAKEKFAALTDAQKELVTNKATLDAAIEKIAELKGEPKPETKPETKPAPTSDNSPAFALIPVTALAALVVVSRKKLFNK